MRDGRRGRLISDVNRRQALELISEAVDFGAALYIACAKLGISKRTYSRWKNNTHASYPIPISELVHHKGKWKIVKKLHGFKMVNKYINVLDVTKC